MSEATLPGSLHYRQRMTLQKYSPHNVLSLGGVERDTKDCAGGWMSTGMRETSSNQIALTESAAYSGKGAPSEADTHLRQTQQGRQEHESSRFQMGFYRCADYLLVIFKRESPSRLMSFLKQIMCFSKAIHNNACVLQSSPTFYLSPCCRASNT